MADRVYAGTSGRIQSAVVTADLATDVITFTAGTRVAQVFITKWDGPKVDGAVIKSMTLESTADAQGNLAGENVRGGTIAYTFSVQGLFSATEALVFMTKQSMVADFIVKKTTAGAQEGWPAVPGTIQNFAASGVDSSSNDVQKCSFEYVVSGHLPAFSSTI